MQIPEILDEDSSIKTTQKEGSPDVDMNFSTDTENFESVIQKYHDELLQKLKQTFIQPGDIKNSQRDQEFKDFLFLFDKIASDVIQEPRLQNVFDIPLMRLVVKVCQDQTPWSVKQAIVLLQNIFTKNLVSKRLLNLKGVERYVIDLINVLLTLRQQVRHTYLELIVKHTTDAVLSQLESNNDPVIMQSRLQLRQIESMTISLRESIQKIVKSLRDPQTARNEFIKLVQLSLSQSESQIEQYNLFAGEIQDLVRQFLAEIINDPPKVKVQFLNHLWAIYERFIPQCSFTILFELHNMHETKSYNLRNEKQLLLNHPQIYYGVGDLLNQMMLLPNEAELQLNAFTLIRRLYTYFPTLHPYLKGPIFLCLRNISLFCQNLSDLKIPTVFYYKLVNKSDYEESYKEALKQDEDLRYLRENKYYSIKALSYKDDYDFVYTLKDLNPQVMFPSFTIINAASLLNYSIIVEKPNSLIYWNFKTLDYDLSFGLYRLNLIEDLGINDYLQEKNGIKQLIKLQRMDCHKQPVTGVTLITNPGFYRIIFDNSYSYFRPKQLFFYIHVLEPK